MLVAISKNGVIATAHMMAYFLSTWLWGVCHFPLDAAVGMSQQAIIFMAHVTCVTPQRKG